MRRLLGMLTTAALIGCQGCSDPASHLARIDPSQPFEIEFGRGSGLHGLETVGITSDGSTTMVRKKWERHEGGSDYFWESTTFKLADESITKVLTALADTGVMRLDHAYHGSVEDGTQWVFWVRQGEKEHSVYCDNRFPISIKQFAKTLDEILASSVAQAKWERVAKADERKHEKRLWDSIKR